VVTGGTLKGNIIARRKTEVTEAGRVEGTIRSKALVVSEGALFAGQASIDLEDAEGSAYQGDELQIGYDESVRRAADWYRSTLYGRTAEQDQSGARNPDAAVSEPDEITPDLSHEPALAWVAPGHHDGSEAEERR
jgi:hypothetical protein